MIKRLAKSIREYKKNALLAPLYVSGEVVLEVIIPLLMAYLIDNGIEKSDMGYVWACGGLLAICAVISLVCGVLAGKHASIASAGFARKGRAFSTARKREVIS